MCERCNALDGRRTKTYKIEKGEAVVSRVLCDGCARLTNETYPVRGVPAAPKPEPAPEAEPEAAPEAPAAEGEETGDGEPTADEPEPEAETTPRSPRGRTRG